MDKGFISRFLKGSLASSLGQFTTVFFHFLSISLMARNVDKIDFGIYEIILAIATGGKILGSMGLDLTLIQFLSTRTARDQRHAMSTVLFIRLIVMSLFTLVFYLLGAYLLPLFDGGEFSGGLTAYRWILPTIFVLMSFRELFLFVLQGLQQFRNLAIVQTVSAILKFGLIWSLSARLNLNWLLVIECIMLISSLGYLIYLIPFSQYKLDRITLNVQSFREIFKFSWPLYVNQFVNYTSNFGGTFIIGGTLSVASVANFTNAAKMPQGVSRLLDSFRVVYFPTLSQLFASGKKDDAIQFMNKTLVLLASVIFAGAIFSMLFSEELVLLILSEKYIEVQPTFVILMLAICFGTLANTMGFSLVSSGNPQKSTQVNIFAIIFQLAMLIILIPRIGYPGAAVANLVMHIVSQIAAYFALRSVGAPINLQEYLKPYVFLISIIALYYFLGFETIIFKAGLLILYVTLCVTLIDDCREALVFIVRMALSRRVRPNPA